MSEKVKNDSINSSIDDREYLKLLESNGYKIFNPKTNSQEEIILKELRTLIKVFLGPKALNIDINVKIYLIDNSMINAGVCKRGETYYISLFRGVIVDLREFVLTFVMENFPHDFFNNQHEELYKNQIKVFEFFNEDDCEHYQLSNNIANNILFSIVYHEIGHIFSGHQEDITTADELFMEANQYKEGNIDAQSRELMADFFSIINTLGIYDNSHHTSFEEYTFNHCCYLISLYSLYIYFEKKEYQNKEGNALGTYEELLKRSHPHPAIRLLYMLDFLEADTEHKLKQLFKVAWLTKDNEEEILTKIDQLSYLAICEFSMKLSEDFRLLNKCYEKEALQIRQLVQNTASDLYEEKYRKVAIIPLKEIGRVSDKYVDDILEQNVTLGKYDVL